MTPRAVALLVAMATMVAAWAAAPQPTAQADANESVTYRVAAASVAAGARHTCALLTTGDVRCWGSNLYGQLGYGHVNTIGDDETPASAAVVDLGGRAIAITAGDDHTCALLATGDIRCWGDNGSGQLGYGHVDNIGDNESPANVPVVDVGGRAVAITAGARHTCALLATGGIRCWGENLYGQLGYGHISAIGNNETPASQPVLDIGGPAAAITAGGLHTCAVLATGNVRCWGDNSIGQLGYGHTNAIGDNETPASQPVVDVGGTVAAISAGGVHTCALLATGDVRCWGFNGSGQLGYGHRFPVGDDEVPASVAPVEVGGSVAVISAGGYHTCAVLRTGELRCWGQSGRGQLGYGNTSNVGDDEDPADVPPVQTGGSVAAITADFFHTCALLTNGSLRCWGNNDDGQLGYGHTSWIGDDETPASVAPVATGGKVRVRAVTATTARARPSRDRRAPYVYRFSGKVGGAFVVDAATCTGKVTVTVKKRRRKLAATTVSLRPDCRYRARVVVSGRKLDAKKRTRLVAQIAYRGSSNLTRSAKRLRLIAR